MNSLLLVLIINILVISSSGKHNESQTGLMEETRDPRHVSHPVQHILIAVERTSTVKNHKFDRYVIACHTTDFECFKRQFRALRDKFLLGNMELGIDFYEPYKYRYGDTGTCIMFSGVEDSELVGISLDAKSLQFTMTIETTLNIHQIMNATVCDVPKEEMGTIRRTGGLRKFKVKATANVTYPYQLRGKKKHMDLGLENLDLILDVPDLSLYDPRSKQESILYEWSEWAYEVVQHVDVAKYCLLPLTRKLKEVMDRYPLEKFILLYPEEEYINLQFEFKKPLQNDFETMISSFLDSNPID